MLDPTAESAFSRGPTFREACASVEDELERTFDRHQWALTILDLATAELELSRYRRGLESFLSRERDLLDLYAERDPALEAGDVETYSRECADLENGVAILAGDLRRLREAPPPRGVNPLLRLESDFLVTVTRHFLRARHRLFPALDRLLREDERRRMVRRLDAMSAPEVDLHF